MTLEMAFVGIVIVVAVVMMVSGRILLAQVAAAIPVVLLLSGVISVEEALSGLSHPATVTVTAMMVLSLGLVRTGVVDMLSGWVQSAPLGEGRMRLFVLCLTVALVSPFLNNTAVVAVFLPVFLALAAKIGEPPSRVLMPLSFAAILGGTITLVGTSTNLIVSGMMSERGYDDLHMFSIAPLGLVTLAVGMTYMFTIGRRLLPHRDAESDLAAKYDMRVFGSELVVEADSRVVDVLPADLQWDEKHGVEILGVERAGRTMWGRRSRRKLREGDALIVQGSPDALLQLAEQEKLSKPSDRKPDAGKPEEADGEEMRFAELLVAPRSDLVNRTLRGVQFRRHHGATVLGIQRHGDTIGRRLGRTRLRAGDLLLVHGTASNLEALADVPGLVPLGHVQPAPRARERALLATAILAGVVLVAGLGLTSILVASLVGVVLMLYTRCLSLTELVGELDWQVPLLLAGLLPLGIALENSGAASALAQTVADHLGGLGPMAMVAGFYLLTSLLTEAMSNNAAAVVLAPIALEVAENAAMNPYALLVAVMFGASASVMTPVGYQTNTMIYGPGGYRFGDFVRVGVPLNILLWVTASLLIPLIWS